MPVGYLDSYLPAIYVRLVVPNTGLVVYVVAAICIPIAHGALCHKAVETPALRAAVPKSSPLAILEAASKIPKAAFVVASWIKAYSWTGSQHYSRWKGVSNQLLLLPSFNEFAFRPVLMIKVFLYSCLVFTWNRPPIAFNL
ncbi:hypothetical protein [Peribacillus frigoritolerans]|uniref:hypothetical protein n=1 Tax=Peribacillus frigoritolerans TaxID=450367 RepID=UPI0034212162